MYSCAYESSSFLNLRFENDVKKYGTQTETLIPLLLWMFENDVKKYGTQTPSSFVQLESQFENDVKKYGTQTPDTNVFTDEGLRMM